jgi:hypothetical protein
VIERQGVKDAVVDVDFDVDQAADVFGDHRVVRQHRPLGPRLGAAGVDDLREHRAGQRTVRDVGRQQKLAEPCQASDGVGRILAGKPDRFGDRGIGTCLAPELGEAAVDAEHAGARVIEDVLGFLGAQHEVDRHQHRAEPCERESQRGKGMRVARDHCDPVADLDPMRGQSRGQAVDDVVELRVGPIGATATDGQLAPKPEAGSPQQVAQGLARDIGVHDGSLGFLNGC